MVRKWNGIVAKKPFVINNHYSQRPKPIFFYSFLVVIIVLLIAGFNFVRPNWNEMVNNFSLLGERIKALVSWDFSEFKSVPAPDLQPHSFLYLSWQSIWQTLVMTFAGSVLGIILALPVAIFAAKNIYRNKIVNSILKIMLAMFRTVPAFVFSLIFVGFFGPNLLTVTIAIIIFSFAISTKMIYDRIEQIVMAPYEVLQATGANKFTCFRAAAFPQIMRHVVSTWWYVLEVNIRYSAIIGLVARVGIGQMIKNKIDNQEWSHVGWLLFLLIVAIMMIEFLAFATKKWIMNDNDKILDRRVTTRLTRKTRCINKLPTYLYWKKVLVLASWRQERKTLQANYRAGNLTRTTYEQQYKFLKSQKRLLWQAARKTYRNNIIADKSAMRQARKKQQPLVVFDQQLCQKVRLDKLTISRYRYLVILHKQTTLAQQQKLADEYHVAFKNNLTPALVYHKAPANYIKRLFLAAIIFAFFIYSFMQIDFDLASKEQRLDTWQHIKDMFNISWTSLFGTTGQNGHMITYSAASLVLETIMIAILGTFFGFICAFILGMLSCHYVTNKYIAKFFWMIATFIRPIPSYLYALILITLTGFGAFTGVLALAIATTGMLSKYIREAFNDIDGGAVEVLTASGANYWQRFRYGILPQVSGNIVSWAIYRFSINITEAAILGVVSAGHFGFMLKGYWDDGYYRDFGTLLFAMIITTVILELIISLLRNKINNGLDPYPLYRLQKTIRRERSPWYIINGQLLGYATSQMTFDELRALYKYSNITIFRASLTKWLSTCYQFPNKKRVTWKNAYALSYCSYFKLDITNSEQALAIMTTHHRQYITSVKMLIGKRRTYLQSSQQEKKAKIKTLYAEYDITTKQMKQEQQKLRHHYQQVRKKHYETNNHEQIKQLKQQYVQARKKRHNDVKVLKNDLNNNVVMAQNSWKSVKVGHE